MRAIIQRVKEASVEIEGREEGRIGQGILSYICVTENSSAHDFEWMCNKIHSLRIFTDKNKKLNLSLVNIKEQLTLDDDLGILLIPNFSLFANVKKGNRPSFAGTIAFDDALEKFSQFTKIMRTYSNSHGLALNSGRFGANMQVYSIADGPMNIIIDSPSMYKVD